MALAGGGPKKFCSTRGLSTSGPDSQMRKFSVTPNHRYQQYDREVKSMMSRWNCKSTCQLKNASCTQKTFEPNWAAIRVCSILCIAVLGILFAWVARAQTNLTSIAGTITDKTGAVVPNCQVEAKKLDTSGTRTITTNGQGDYLFSLLPVGSYEVSASAPGFGRSAARINVTLTGASLSLSLSIAQTSSEVEVEASASDRKSTR